MFSAPPGRFSCLHQGWSKRDVPLCSGLSVCWLILGSGDGSGSKGPVGATWGLCRRPSPNLACRVVGSFQLWADLWAPEQASPGT